MKVLIATDGSKSAEDAAVVLARLPHTQLLELTVLAVKYFPGFQSNIDHAEWIRVGGEQFSSNKSSEACKRIEAMFQGANARVETVIMEGHPGITIVEEAKNRNVDLIVVGAQGHSFFERAILGSVSDFVATHASCSVLVVRPDGLTKEGSPKLDICIAYDDSEASKYSLTGLGDLQWQRETKIDLVSVISMPYAYGEIPIEFDNKAIRVSTTQTLNSVAKELNKFSSQVQCHVIEADHVGSGIVGTAEKNGNNLIVLGDTGRGLLGRFFLGSVSRYVLHHARCSVAIARKPSMAKA